MSAALPVRGRRRAQWSWALYDWANSAYATTVMAGFFPVFFKSYWTADMTVTESTFQLGATNAVASLLALLLAPLLGVLADRRGSGKKALLFTLAMLGALMSGGLFLVAEGYWLVAAGLYVLGVIGFAGGNVAYDALLVDVAERNELERVSALGFALGYLGGGLLFALNVLMVLFPESFGLADKAAAVRVSFLLVGIWWAVFSLPVLLFVREVPRPHPASLAGGVRAMWRELVSTWRLLRSLPMAFTFLLAYWFYIDGVDTIVRMAVDYGLSLGFAAEGLLTALLITQAVGFPAALAFGRIGDRIGAQRAIWLALAVYVIVVFWAWRMQAEWEFYALAVLIGLVQGGIQSMSRALYTRLIPAEHAGRLFGLYNMMGKFAAVVGPLLVGWVALLSGSARTGILSVLLLFLVGAVLLARVRVAEGERDALRAEV